MRVLLIHPGPNFSVADVHNGWAEALRELGCQVSVYNLDDRLNFYQAAWLETGSKDDDGRPEFVKALDQEHAIRMAANGVLSACYQFWPDIVLCVSAFFTPVYLLEMMRGRGHKVVLLHTESPYQDGEQLLRAPAASLNLLNDPVNLDAYRQHGPAEYMPHAYRPEIHHPGPGDPDLACDLAFSGTAFPSRVDFLQRMDLTGLDVLLAGHWLAAPEGHPLLAYMAHDLNQCLDNERTADLYRSARCGINIYRREAEDAHTGEGWAAGPREIEMAACGLFFLRDPRGEGDALFPTLPRFETPPEATGLLRWYLAHDNARQAAAAAAMAAVADRTFIRNATEMLRLLDRQPAVIT